MPELIEVLVTGQFLNLKTKNKIITNINIIGGRYKKHKNSLKGYELVKQNLPLKINEINTKGKFLWFELENYNNKLYLLNTFGMSGRWSFKKENHSNIELVLKSKNKKYSLYFSDQRNFGTIVFGNKKKLSEKLNHLAPDFLKEKLNSNILKKRISNYLKISSKRKNVKIIKVLMSQNNKDGIGSGIGNYLAPEILYRAKISPHKTMDEIYNNDKLIKKLAKSIKYIVKLAYINNDVGYMVNFISFSKKHRKLIKDEKLPNYHKSIKIKKNEFFDFIIYKQNKDPLGNLVKKEKIVFGRTTHWVPDIQK